MTLLTPVQTASDPYALIALYCIGAAVVVLLVHPILGWFQRAIKEEAARKAEAKRRGDDGPPPPSFPMM